MRAFLICVTAAVLLVFSSTAKAITWNDAFGGSFSDGSNWNGGAVPGAADNATFDISGATFTVNFTSSVFNDNLIVGRSDVTFNLNGFAYNLTRTTPESIFVGELAFDTAALTVTNGALNGMDATVAQTAGGTGALNIPTGGTLNLLDRLIVGEGGAGTMDVTGGTVNTDSAIIAQVDGSMGDVLLSGTTSFWDNTGFMSMSAGDSSLTVQNGARMDTDSLTIGSSFTSIADVVLDGNDSQINVAGTLTMSNVGGVSTLTVQNGADLTSGRANIGNVGIGTDARALVTGVGSTWTSTDKISASLRGDAPGGLLEITNGGVVTSVEGAIGELSDSEGEARIDGAGSRWDMSGDFQVGEGKATLSITDGGRVTNLNGDIGTADATRTIDITVDGSGSRWDNAGSLTGGIRATMSITNGAVVTADSVVSAVNFTMDGPGSSWLITNNFNTGNSTTIPSTISNGAFLSSDGASITSGSYLVDNGIWNNSGDFTFSSNTTLPVRISNGGSMSNASARMVSTAGDFATMIVEGPGSIWDSVGALEVGDAPDNGAGSGGVASLTIRDGAYVRADEVFVATVATAQSTILVEGNGALWESDSDLILGSDTIVSVGGTADLTIGSGGRVLAGGVVKTHVGSNITLLGGTLEVGNSQDLVTDQPDGFDFVFGTLKYSGAGTFGFSDLQTLLGNVPTLGTGQRLEVGGAANFNTGLIIDGGTLSVGQLQGSSTPQFLNGRLELTNDNLTVGLGTTFGPVLTLQSNRTLFVGNTLTVNAGSVLTVDQTTLTAGTLVNEGEMVINGASALINGGTMSNMGLVTGNGRIDLGLTNTPTGTIRVAGGHHLIIERQANNDGRIDLTGGTAEFTSFLQNNTGGLVIGSGTLISRSAIINDGEMAFSGATNIVGDTANNATGLIVVTGSGPATFFDDLVHNGEIRTSAGATTVYLGSVSGSGSYTGSGTNLFEGDFTPGSSPGDILFEGDVVLTETATLEVELLSTGGVPGSDFDRLNILGDIDIDGVLDVSLLGGYTPTVGDSFPIISAGSRNGTFASFAAPALPGGLMFDVVYSPTGVTLNVVGALAGDLDGDGFVGINDLNIVLGNWNQNVPPANPLADPSGDGFVGIDDLNAVLGNWNAGTPPNTTTSIPEPGSIGMTILFGLLLQRRRSQSL